MCSNYLKYICQWDCEFICFVFRSARTTFDCHWWGRIHTLPLAKNLPKELLEVSSIETACEACDPDT